MSDPPDPSEDVSSWLTGLHLAQYIGCFQRGGYWHLEDCRDLTEERLLELGVNPTGHRRRILRGVEAPGAEPEGEATGRGWKKPVPWPRHIFKDPKTAASCRHPQPPERPDVSKGGRTLPPGAGLWSEDTEGGYTDSSPPSGSLRIPLPAQRDPRNIHRPSSNASTTSSSDAVSVSSLPSDWETGSEDPSPFAAEIPMGSAKPQSCTSEEPEGFPGEMVDNAIYEDSSRFQGSRGLMPTHSYKLRHRPVPDIPGKAILPLQDWRAPTPLTTSTEHLPTNQAPTGANGKQKSPLQRTLTPIHPYGEIFLYNTPGTTLEGDSKRETKVNKTKKLRRKQARQEQSDYGVVDRSHPPLALIPPNLYEDAYSTVKECTAALGRANHSRTHDIPPPVAASGPASMTMVECELYSESFDALGGLIRNTLPLQTDISPYACFYSVPKSTLKTGWLDKLSPQGKHVFQRRWVRLDGEGLAYYNNDKEMYSKGLIPVGVMKQVRLQGDNKFEVVTSLRVFIFRTEREAERQEWLEALQTAITSPAPISQKPSSKSRGGGVLATSRSSSLELRGYKGKVFVSLAGTRFRLCKSEQDFKAGLAVAVVDLTAANIKDVDRRGFEINTPFKNFCFTAESEWEKEEWIEAVQESIAETLSDYEVAEKIWFNESNRSCAECGAPQPEWASVNLGVVICKKCAGQHRFLGPSLSKVRSLKLDSTIWSNELVELFLEVGNKKANSFWAATLPPEEGLLMAASPEQRASFHRRKYRERKYRRVLEGLPDQEQLNQALCAAVVLPDVLQTMALVFSGADVMCATGDPMCSTPYLLAQRAGHKLQMEFLHHNKLSDFPVLDPVSECSAASDAPSFMDGFLYCSPGPSRATLDRRGRDRDDLVRRWCTLEGGFLSYYENERTPAALGRVDITDVISLTVSHTETMTGAGAVFTVELYLQSERVLLFGAETEETQRDWVRAITKCFVPAKVEAMLRPDSELIGRLFYKEGHDLYHWRVGWFSLEGSTLHFSSGKKEGTEGALQLKQLQELTISTHVEGEERMQVLLMVEGGRTVYIHSYNKVDFALWHSAIRLAAGTDGKALSNQQLSKNGVPIVVDSCIAFVTQYGLGQEGLYQRKGDPARVAQLLEAFRGDARNVKLRLQEHGLEEVTQTLRTFLSQTEDALLTKELYPYWVSALDEKDERDRVKKYSAFIRSLPKINRSTLAALLQHLFRVQWCSHLNQMQTQDLARVFSPCLFQTDGQNEQEASVVQDLINNYVQLFDVQEDQVKQMKKENSFITRWNDKKDATFSPAGDLIFEVYLERREPENCCLIKLSPTMRSDELTETTLGMKNIVTNAGDFWTAYEVIENGELERPLHYKEKVLEQVLEWSTMDDPSSAFLVIKKFKGVKTASERLGQKQCLKGDYLKYRDGSSKLLTGSKFQDRYVVLKDDKLLLYKDIKNTKPEREITIKCGKCYLGLKKKLKAPTSWGFTVYTDKQQWHFCCEGEESQVTWVTDIIQKMHGADLWSRNTDHKTPVGHKATIGRAGAGGQKTKNNIPKQPPEKVFSLNLNPSDGGPLPGVGGSALFKATLLSDCLKPKDQLRIPDAGLRRASVPALPLCPSSRPSPRPGPLPLSPKPGARRPMLGGEGAMPPSFLHELNTVLSKTGRIAKEES